MSENSPQTERSGIGNARQTSETRVKRICETCFDFVSAALKKEEERKEAGLIVGDADLLKSATKGS